MPAALISPVRRARAVRPAWSALLASAGGVLVAAAGVAPLVHRWLTNPAHERLVDLDVYRSAGQSVLIGRPIYDHLTAVPQLLPFTYPPLSAVLAVPLALVPWAVLGWLWTGLTLVALGVTAWYAFRPLLDRAGRWSPVLLGVLVAATAYVLPMRDDIRFGNVDIMLVALCVADCAARGPRWARGTLVGLATAIKLTPGVFVVYLWLTGRRRAALTAAGTAVAATLLTALLLPADSAQYWFRTLLDSDRLGANKGTQNQAIRGALLRLYLPDMLTLALWILLVAAVAYVGFRYARRASSSGREVAGVAIVGLLAALLSPVGWIHHFAWLVVAVGALAGDGRDVRRLGAAAGTWLFFTLPMPWYGVTMLADGIGPRWAGRVVQSSFCYGGLALILVLGAWLLRRRKVDRPREPAGPPRLT